MLLFLLRSTLEIQDRTLSIRTTSVRLRDIRGSGGGGAPISGLLEFYRGPS